MRPGWSRSKARRLSGAAGPWNGLISDPALIAWLGARYGDEYLWSPTQLESYAKCPWSWFSGRLLRLEKLEDPDEEMDPATRGTILHETLQLFYDTARQRVGGPVFLRADRPCVGSAAAQDSACRDPCRCGRPPVARLTSRFDHTASRS